MRNQKVKSYLKSSAFFIDSCVFIVLLFTLKPWLNGSHQFLRILVVFGVPILLVHVSFKQKNKNVFFQSVTVEITETC